MGAFNISSTQFNNFLQNIQTRYVVLELLNYQFQVVGTIDGKCIGGNISIDANSDIRRTGNVEFVINNSDFEVEPGGQIWLDKYIRVFIGIKSLYIESIKNKVIKTFDQYSQLSNYSPPLSSIVKILYDETNNNQTTYYKYINANENIWEKLGCEIEYTNCGIFIIDAPSYQYDPSTNVLTLSLLDLMAKLTGIRNGYLPGVPVILSAGESIRQTIIDTLALGGFTKYVVEEPPSPGTIPNDLEFGQGATVYDLLVGLRDVYPNYEIFFDVNGVFYYKPIPTGVNDPIYIDDTLWTKIVTEENIDVDFQNVKNVIEVYGRTHDPAHFSTNTSVSNNTISLTIEDVTEYTKDLIYGFTLTDNPGYNGYNLQINNLTSYPILLSDGETIADIPAESGEIYYCVQFAGTYWNYLGHLQAYGYAEDDNPQSPFYINGTVGQIRLPLYGGEYENCYTDDLAQQRAEYELWLHTNMNNSLQLTCVVVPWIDVNILVQYTSQRTKQTNEYIIKSINFGLEPSDSMTISMIQFYPNSSSIVGN